MKRNFSDYIVAVSVILVSFVLLAALTIALSGYRLKKPTRTLQINYEDVTGIKVHSELRYAGAPAGRVIAMRHLTAKERESSPNKRDAVQVTVSLDAAIEGHPAYGIEQITAAAGPLLDNLNVTVANLKNDLGQFTPKLGPLADSLRIDLDNLQNVVKNLEGVSKDADTVLGTADTFISATDKQLQEQLKQLHVVLLNLKVITTHAKALVETLAEKPNRLIFSGKPAKLTPEAEILRSSKPLPAKRP